MVQDNDNKAAGNSSGHFWPNLTVPREKQERKNFQPITFLSASPRTQRQWKSSVQKLGTGTLSLYMDKENSLGYKLLASLSSAGDGYVSVALRSWDGHNRKLSE